ncbi:hypothetical protein Emed_003992 [Eimeria media]
MASARKLEGALQLSVPRKDSPLTVQAEHGLNTEGGSAGSNGLFFRHEHPRRALEVNSVIAVVLAALVVAYLLVTCVRHLSKNLRVSSHQVRLLASNFPDGDEGGDKCPAPPGNDGKEAAASTAEGDTGLAEAGGAAAAAAAAQPEEMGAAAPPNPPPQSRRHLPPVTQTLLEKTLLLLQHPAAVVTPILHLMKPDLCFYMVKTLCRLVAAELSAFSTVPLPLQPLRQQVAAAYITLINHALAVGARAYEPQQMEWRRDLRTMQQLLHRLAETPPESENFPTQYYSTIMECQQRASHWVLSQVLHAEHAVVRFVTPGYVVNPDEATYRQLQVLNALCLARLHQILNSGPTRYWLQRQQRLVKADVAYSSKDLSKAIHQNPGSTSDRLLAISNAVLAAGGLPTTVWAPLPLTLQEQQQQLQAHQTLQQQLHQQHLDQQHLHQQQLHQQLLHQQLFHQQQLHQQQLHQQPQGVLHAHMAGAYGPFPTPPMPPPAGQPPMVPQTPYAMPHHHQPPLAEHQPVLPFDPAIQDADFPTIHPDPQLSSDYVILEESFAPRVDLPLIYELSDPPVPLPLEPPTSSSAPAISGGLSGDFSAHGHHSGSTDQTQPTQPTPQQTPTSAPKPPSSEDKDAR